MTTLSSFKFYFKLKINLPQETLLNAKMVNHIEQIENYQEILMKHLEIKTDYYKFFSLIECFPNIQTLTLFIHSFDNC